MNLLQTRVILSLFALLITNISYSQTTYTWIGANGGSWATAGNWSPARSVLAANDILQFNDGTTKTVTNVPTQTIGRLSVSSNTSVTLNSASANRTLTVGGGAGTDFSITLGSTLTIGTTNTNFSISLPAGAAADIYGALVVGAGEVYATNTAGTVTALGNNGSIQNMGTVTCTNATRLTLPLGALYVHAQNGGTIPTATWDANSTCYINGVTNTVPSGLGQSFGNLTWFCTQSADLSLNGALTTVNGDLFIAKTNSRRLFLGTNNVVTLNVAADLTIGGIADVSIFDMDSNNGNITINVGGDLTTYGTSTIDNFGTNNATFNFNKSSGIQNIILNNAASFGPDWGGIINIGTGSSTNTVALQKNMAMGTTFSTAVNVLNGSTLDINAFVISNRGTFTANTGSTLGIGHASGIAAAGATGNVQVSSTRTFNTGVNYAYDGTVAQITGAGLPATVNKLIIDNTSGVNTSAGVTLTQATAVTTELVLTNSFLKTTAANILTLNTGSIVTPTNNSFVAGPMRKTGNTNFTFPTGWSGASGGRIPISITSLSASATVQAEYKRLTAATVGTAATAPLVHVSGCEYWELFPTAGSITTTVTMNWNSYSNCSPVAYVTDFVTLVIARSNGTTWTSAGNTGGSLGSGTIISNAAITINNTTPFKYFSLGSTSFLTNPLPVLFTDVKAYEKNNDIQIEWTNLTEKDILTYTVERSTNGRDFTDINSKLPVNNQGDKASYAVLDATPAQSANYYRIKAQEVSGKIIYTKILRVDLSKGKPTLSLYPNPVISKELTFSLSGVPKGMYNLLFVNSTGQQIYNKVIQVQGDVVTQNVSLPSSFRPGVYTLVVSGQDWKDNKVFVVE
jgi:hypothetical protein